MHIDDLLDSIQRKIQDTSYSREDDLLPLVNQGLGEIAATVPLPGLFTMSDLVCPQGQYIVDLPADFGNWLLQAYNTTRKTPVRLYQSVTELLSHYPEMDAFAPLCAAARYGPKLYVQGVPDYDSGETVRLSYYKKPTFFTPTTATEAVTEIDFIPEELQSQLLVNYACKEVFNEIEDGVEGTKVNWNTYRKRYDTAFGRLFEVIGQSPQQPQYVIKTQAELVDGWLITGDVGI